MKITRNWVSHAKLLEPLNAQFVAYLFVVNMRAMFRLPKTILPYEQALLNLIDSLPTPNVEINQVKDKIEYAEQLVDEHLASLRMDSEKHFGEKINDIYRRVTGNPDAEKYDFQRFLFQYFWKNQQRQLRNLVANSDEFLPTLARHIYYRSFTRPNP